ncbi:hypothetical protein CHU98_g3900 [Xylaria longipes]|nr:hypothetical protein CHU98_g3900 [Xylaria longipes]
MAPSQLDNASSVPANNEQRQSQQEEMQEIALQPMTSLPMGMSSPYEHYEVLKTCLDPIAQIKSCGWSGNVIVPEIEL